MESDLIESELSFEFKDCWHHSVVLLCQQLVCFLRCLSPAQVFTCNILQSAVSFTGYALLSELLSSEAEVHCELPDATSY